MYKLLTAASSIILFSSAANASSVTGEIRFADPNSKSDSTEYKVEYSNDITNKLYLGAELQVKQRENEGSLSSKLSVKAGTKLPTLLVFSPVAYLEGGRSFESGHNFNFWGAGLKATAKVYGPVSVGFGYRHREGFSYSGMNEERLNGGVALNLTDTYSLGAQYYRTRGTSDSDAIGLSVTHKF